MDAQWHSKLFNKSKNMDFSNTTQKMSSCPSILVILQTGGDLIGGHQLSLDGAEDSATAHAFVPTQRCLLTPQSRPMGSARILVGDTNGFERAAQGKQDCSCPHLTMLRLGHQFKVISTLPQAWPERSLARPAKVDPSVKALLIFLH